jgi:septal ring factor EnvC (AmiA/AmiB activator)
LFCSISYESSNVESVIYVLCGGLLHYPFLSPQKSLKQEHFLWQLYNIEKDVAKTTKELETEVKSREDVIKDLEKFEREAGKKKKEQSKYSKEITHLEKRIAERSNKLDRNVSSQCSLTFPFLFFFFFSSCPPGGWGRGGRESLGIVVL